MTFRDFLKMGLLIAWIAVALFGLALVGLALRFYNQAGGSYMAIPEIVGFVGVYVAFQGIANVRRIIKKPPPAPNIDTAPIWNWS